MCNFVRNFVSIYMLCEICQICKN